MLLFAAYRRRRRRSAWRRERKIAVDVAAAALCEWIVCVSRKHHQDAIIYPYITRLGARERETDVPRTSHRLCYDYIYDESDYYILMIMVLTCALCMLLCVLIIYIYDYDWTVCFLGCVSLYAVAPIVRRTTLLIKHKSGKVFVLAICCGLVQAATLLLLDILRRRIIQGWHQKTFSGPKPT